MRRKKKLFCLAAALTLGSAGNFAHSQALLTGKASFYSNKLHGRKMSNGQLYNKDSLTCAHMKFPFGTLLKVTNVLNGKEVVVKVTDRGPYCKRYIIDLSFAAAKKLGIITSGFSPVEIVPYVETKVPYQALDSVPAIPELDMQYMPAATYPEPAWQRDSTFNAPTAKNAAKNEPAKTSKKAEPAQNEEKTEPAQSEAKPETDGKAEDNNDGK